MKFRLDRNNKNEKQKIKKQRINSEKHGRF